ncbi:hypothetical protein [Frankia sp. EI5c]|uniref:hypothetical protein n=1 Tax=Frankia sp. EI5c TaxID=683316 RepID=UPI0018FEC99C|nr:hypothetical protein [Frankia sp. EI5c]
MYEGVRNYKSYYSSEEEFHEHCEYFYVHIGEAEKEHRIQAVESAAPQVCADATDLARVQAGFDGFLDLTVHYWRGVVARMRAAGDLRGDLAGGLEIRAHANAVPAARAR